MPEPSSCLDSASTPRGRPVRRRWITGLRLAPAIVAVACSPGGPEFDVLLRGGRVVDGSGGPAVLADVGLRDGFIVEVGELDPGSANEELDLSGLVIAPGFIDMHSHAELEEDYGRDGKPFLAQGITTVVMGVDGFGTWKVGERLASWAEEGIGVNALAFVGHGAIRREVLGSDDRPPTSDEMERMKMMVRNAMEEGALGLSTGLFYTPAFYASTEEVIELGRVAAEWDGAIYDTHDRDLGATYQGIGYDASVAEGIRIGEESGLRVIFSHFNPQGSTNRGRAEVGAALIAEARDRGVEVSAAQHPYTATQSNLRAYALPRWAAAGGREAVADRFADPDTLALLRRQIVESLAMRGGPQMILFADPDPRLNGKTLAEVGEAWGADIPTTVRRILEENGNATVMNLELYDPVNTRYLAQKPWMMTCTDGRTPAEGQAVTHPRVYGAFPKKLREFVVEEELLELPFVIRSFTGLAADFLRLSDRGYVRAGMRADLVVFDLERYEDRATFEEPHQYSEGVEHLMINGQFAIRNGAFTEALAGHALRADGRLVEGLPVGPGQAGGS